MASINISSIHNALTIFEEDSELKQLKIFS